VTAAATPSDEYLSQGMEEKGGSKTTSLTCTVRSAHNLEGLCFLNSSN